MANMTVPQMFVISMAVSSALLAGSGFNAWAGVGYDPGLGGPMDDLHDTAREDPESSVVTDAVNLIGLAIAAIQIIVDMFVWVYLFPFALMNIGFPAWFAIPIGAPIEYVNIVGTAEFMRGFRSG